MYPSPITPRQPYEYPQSSIRNYIRHHQPHLLNHANGVFDFHGLGTTISIGLGAATAMHIDGGDSPYALTIIISGGTAVVYFCIPQLHIKIPLYPHQALVVAARLLSHYAYRIEGTGERVLYTFFTDASTLSKIPRL